MGNFFENIFFFKIYAVIGLTVSRYRETLAEGAQRQKSLNTALLLALERFRLGEIAFRSHSMSFMANDKVRYCMSYFLLFTRRSRQDWLRQIMHDSIIIS